MEGCKDLHLSNNKDVNKCFTSWLLQAFIRLELKALSSALSQVSEVSLGLTKLWGTQDKVTYD